MPRYWISIMNNLTISYHFKSMFFLLLFRCQQENKANITWGLDDSLNTLSFTNTAFQMSSVDSGRVLFVCKGRFKIHYEIIFGRIKKNIMNNFLGSMQVLYKHVRGITILIHLKMAFNLTHWPKAIYEKISHIHPWITWYIRSGHGILCLGSLNLIRYITHIWTNRHSSII